MKQILRFFCIFFACLVISFHAFASSITINQPTITTINTAYRWSSDVNTITTRTWLTELNEPLIPTVNSNIVYRVRLGANFHIVVTYSYYSVFTGTSTGTAYINSFALQNNIQFASYYKEASSSTWLPIPNNIGSASSTDAICMMPSAYITNGTIIPDDESNNMLVLPGVNSPSNYAAGTRPANPHYYLGGKFYSTQSSSTNVGNIGYTIGSSNIISAGNFPSSNGSYVKVSPKQYLNMGAEIEASIRFLSGVKPNTTYDVKIDLTIPFTGTGDNSSHSGTGSYSLSGTATPSLTGQFTTPGIVLPVTLTAFNVSKQGKLPKLSWTTATEINNKGFYIQRGTDGKSFSNVDFVKTKATSGNSSTSIDYTFTDGTATSSGTLYYRLQQVDQDGTTAYSAVRSITLDENTSNITIAPNPVVSTLTVNNAEVGSSYAIYSLSGQTLKTGTVSSTSYSIDASKLAAGVYILKIVNKSGQHITKKFIRK